MTADQSRSAKARYWTVVLMVALTSIALATGGDGVRLWARYEREALELGELWRLLTGHLVHLGWSHLSLNLIALLLIGGLLEDVSTPLEWLGAGFAAAAAIDLGLYALEPDVQWYVGLSGVLHGLLAFGALKLLVAQRSKVGAVLLVGLGIKVLWEQWLGPIPLSEASAGGPVVVAAHLYGAGAGVLAAAAALAVRHAKVKGL